MSLICNIKLVIRKQSLSWSCFLLSKIRLKKFHIINLIDEPKKTFQRTYEYNRFAPQVPQIPNVAFIFVTRNRMKLSLNLSFSRSRTRLFNDMFITMYININLTVFRQFYEVINVEEQNQVHVAQHQLHDFVDEPAETSRNWKGSFEWWKVIKAHFSGLAMKNSAASTL